MEGEGGGVLIVQLLNFCVEILEKLEDSKCLCKLLATLRIKLPPVLLQWNEKSVADRVYSVTLSLSGNS